MTVCQDSFEFMVVFYVEFHSFKFIKCIEVANMTISLSTFEA